MQVQRIDNMFHFSYTMKSEDIVRQMKSKISSLKIKVEERKKRVKDLRTEYKITDAIYIDLLEQAREAVKKNDNNRMSYTVSNSSHEGGGLQEGGTITIGAGVVNNLMTESDFIKGEESQIKKLDLISRNLRDEETQWSEGRKVGHVLTEAELEYLGF